MMEFSKGIPQNEWRSSRRDDGMLVMEATLPGITIRQLDVIQRQVAPPDATPRTLEMIEDYNARYADIPRHYSTEITFDNPENMVDYLSSYFCFMETKNEVELQIAALDENYLFSNGKPLEEKYRKEIIEKISKIKSDLTDTIRSLGQETWQHSFTGFGDYFRSDNVMCHKEGDQKYRIILTGKKNDDDYMEPDIPILSFRTLIWLRDVGLNAPTEITPAQKQRVFTATDSLLGGNDASSTVKYEEFTIKDERNIKVLLPSNEKVAHN